MATGRPHATGGHAGAPARVGGGETRLRGPARDSPPTTAVARFRPGPQARSWAKSTDLGCCARRRAVGASCDGPSRNVYIPGKTSPDARPAAHASILSNLAVIVVKIVAMFSLEKEVKWRSGGSGIPIAQIDQKNGLTRQFAQLSTPVSEPSQNGPARSTSRGEGRCRYEYGRASPRRAHRVLLERGQGRRKEEGTVRGLRRRTRARARVCGGQGDRHDVVTFVPVRAPMVHQLIMTQPAAPPPALPTP